MSDALSTLAQRLTRGRCAIGVMPLTEGDPDTLPGPERHAIARAIPRRQREFAAGRQAARLAMRNALCVPMGPDRAPVWPSGWTGSITHAGDMAIAAVSRTARMVGIDLECDADLPADILESVLNTAERARLVDLRQARLIFAIKEAAYKAQYPITQQVLGFEAFEVRLEGDRFEAVFQGDIGPFRRGETLCGLFGHTEGLILAAVTL